MNVSAVLLPLKNKIFDVHNLTVANKASINLVSIVLLTTHPILQHF